jgi:hypothetical protein
MDTYLARATGKVKNLTTVKGVEAHDRLLAIANSDAEWRSAAEGLGICKGQIILSQLEREYTGAMVAVLERKVRKSFKSNVPKMAILSKGISVRTRPPRVEVLCGDMTATGRNNFDRAEVSAEERLPTEMTGAGLCKALLGLRTLKFCEDYLEPSEMITAHGHLWDACVQHCVNSHEHKHGGTVARTTHIAEEAPNKRKFAAGGSVFDVISVAGEPFIFLKWQIAVAAAASTAPRGTLLALVGASELRRNT